MSARTIKRYGWRPDLPDHRDRIYNLERPIARVEQLAPVFSLRGKMPAVYNQGELGSCTGNGVAGVLEHQEMTQGEGAQTPSRLFIYYNERAIEGTVGEDSGAQIRDGIKVVAQQGAPPESLWPYDIARFAEKPAPSIYAEAAKHEAIQYLRVIPGGRGSPVRTPISQGFPVVFGFSVPERFKGAWDARSELLPLPSPGEGIIGGHCTVIVGWDFSCSRFPVNAFEVRNSWGPEWGDAGHFWMDARWIYDPWLGLSSDFWVVERVS
jgi:C1A family cysteine protease